MADEMNTDERAKFEAWHKTSNWPNDLGRHDGRYNSNIAEASWQAWQSSAQGFRDGVASLSAAEPAIPALQPVAEDPSFERMFNAALLDMAAIGEALDTDPEEGGAEAILEAIAELKARPTSPAILSAAKEHLSNLRAQRKSLDGFLALGNEVGRAAALDDRIILLENELSATEAPTLTQGAAIAAGAVLTHEQVSRVVDVLVTRSIEITQDASGIKVEYDPIIMAEALGDALRASHGQAPARTNTEVEFDGYKGHHDVRWYINELNRIRIVNQWLADGYCNKLRDLLTAEHRQHSRDERDAERMADNDISALAHRVKELADSYWLPGADIPDLAQFERTHDAVTKRLLSGFTPSPQAAQQGAAS